jgi:REP element-mobilizing transposase RayT
MCLLLQEGIEKYGHRVHAFCLMKNHVHLLIQVGDISLSKIIQNLAFRYSQRINRKNKRIGHLFQGRFKAILIDESTYFTRLLRYIHMNPVRANIVKTPDIYIWSGHNAYTGLSEIAWLTTDYGLSKFGTTREEASLQYYSYILKKENHEELDELRKGFKEGHLLGGDDFIDSIRKKEVNQISQNLSLEAILKAVCQVFDISEESIFSPSKSRRTSFARGMISLIAKDARITIDEIASLMNRDASTISSLISRFNEKHLSLPQTKELIEKARAKATQIAEFHV